jgi:alkylated DNA repair dioxygenase AlkB
MKNKTTKTAVAQIGESVLTDAAPAHTQPTTMPDGTTSRNAPVLVGAGATATTSQSSTATSDQPNKPFEAGFKIQGSTSLKLGGGELLYAETWLLDPEQWFERLKNEVPWSPENVKMYGKPLVLRREICNYGDDYDYNVSAKPAIAWDGPVLELKRMLEQLTGHVFTQCACNLYPDGETGIGLHHDKRHPLLVASISFGAVRTVAFAPKGGKLDKSLPMVPLASGSLLLFSDVINENFKHTIVEDRSVQQPRISVTFREFATLKEPKATKRKTSVALQQKSRTAGLNSAPAGMFPTVEYGKHTDDELHQATVAALAIYQQKREDADDYAYDVLIPALNQIIERYKQQGRPKQYRLNDCPTVDAYFESIGLNYSTVRSWKSRAQQRLLQAAADAGTKPAPNPDKDPIPHLSKAARKALIEGNHKAVEIVAAIDAGRDAHKEIADFKVVMNAVRLDDIMQAHQQEPDYKGILTKVFQTVEYMKSSLPAEFVKTVAELSKAAKLKVAPTAPGPAGKANGKAKPENRAGKGTASKAKKNRMANEDDVLSKKTTQPELQKSDSKSPTPDAPASPPQSAQEERSQNKFTPRKAAHGYGFFVGGEQSQAKPARAAILAHSPLKAGRKYTVRRHPHGGFGIYEPLSPFCLQRHWAEEAAWEVIDAVKVPPSLMPMPEAGPGPAPTLEKQQREKHADQTDSEREPWCGNTSTTDFKKTRKKIAKVPPPTATIAAVPTFEEYVAARITYDDPLKKDFGVFRKDMHVRDVSTAIQVDTKEGCEAYRNELNAKHAPEAVSAAQKKTPKRVQLAQANSLSA